MIWDYLLVQYFMNDFKWMRYLLSAQKEIGILDKIRSLDETSFLTGYVLSILSCFILYLQ